MYLIDKPYISEYLIDTIRETKVPIVAGPEAKEWVGDDSLHWISEKEAVKRLQENPGRQIYSNSENVLGWIEKHLGTSELLKQIKSLKDKVLFREQLRDVFPEFKFQKICLEDIQNLEIDDLSFPFVLKPSAGFLSIGVYNLKSNY